MEESKHHLKNVTYCSDAYDCAKGADVVVLATEWSHFKNLDFNHLGQVMIQKQFVDLRNVYNPLHVRAFGFDYASIGRV